MKIPFNKPFLTGGEIRNIRMAYLKGELAGSGNFTKKCQEWLEKKLGTKRAFLTHSCTSALEMAAILAGIKPGDEVIMPSYTFVSTANAFVLRGGIPVFLDIRPDTLNIDERLIEKAITRKTKAIVPVHYAGVGCEMDTIIKIARKHRLLVIEDAAHGVKATYKGRELGTIGDLGALSFHETKNIITGEGGALLVNNPKFIRRAEIVWQKGTDRSRFMRGEVDKYTWRDIGSSFCPGELVAAFLLAQLEKADKITKSRLNIWKQYHTSLKDLEDSGKFRRPIIPVNTQNNAHMYYLLTRSSCERSSFIKQLKKQNINTVFHYVPLHKSRFAEKNLLGAWDQKKKAICPIADDVSKRLVRLPLFTTLKTENLRKIIKAIKKIYK